MERGGKRSATPLWDLPIERMSQGAVAAALPAHSK